MKSSFDAGMGTQVRTWHITNASPRSVATGIISNNFTNDGVRLQAGVTTHYRTRTEAILRSVQRTATAILLSNERTAEERARRLAGVFQKARSSCSEELPLASILNEPLSGVDLPPLVHEILRLPSPRRDFSSDTNQTDRALDLAVVRFLVVNWDGSLIHIPSIGRGDLSSTVRKACLRRRDDDSGNHIFQMVRHLISSRMAAPELDRRIRGMLALQPSTDFSIDLRALHEIGRITQISGRQSELSTFEGVITARNLHGRLKSSPSISRRGSTHSLRGEQTIRRPLPSPQPSASPTSGWFRDSKHNAIFAAEFLANNCAWSLELGQNSIKLTLLDSEGFINTDGFFVEATIDLVTPIAFSAKGCDEDELPLSYRFALPASRLYFPSQPRKGTNSIILTPCFQTERTSSQDVGTLEDEITGFDDDRLKFPGTGELIFKLTVRHRRPAAQAKVPRRVQGPRPASTQNASRMGNDRRIPRLLNSDLPSPLLPIREASPDTLDRKGGQSLDDSSYPGRSPSISIERRSRRKPLSVSISSASSDVPSQLSGYPQSLSTVATSVELSSISTEISNDQKIEESKLDTRSLAGIDRQSTDLSTSQLFRSQITSINQATKPIEADMRTVVQQIIKDGWRRTILQEIEEVYGINLPVSRRPRWEEHDLEEKTWVFPFSLYFCLQFLHSSSLNGVVFVDVSHSTLLAEVLAWQKQTPLKAIATIPSVRAAVIDILRLTDSPKTTESGRQTLDGAWSQAINYALKRDTDDLTRLISVIVMGGDQVLEEVATSGDKDFHAFTDIIQQIDKQAGSYRTAERFLQKVVKISGRLPNYLFVSDVKRLGDNPLAGGGFADVWKGKAREISVALKVLRIFGLAKSTQPLKEFCMEAMIWRQLRHRNILSFYGVCIDEFSPQLALVSPWMVNGDVLSYTKKYPSVNRVALITEIASGIVYLHNCKPIVVHGDLRSANILVDDRGCPKVADFGLAKVIDSQASAVGGTSFAGKGAMRWQSPELLNSSRFEGIPSGTTTSSDIYALACVCLEIFTEEVPFYYLRDGEVVLEVAIKDTRPRRPSEPAMSRGLSNSLWELMQRCWATHPSARPEIELVCQELREILQAVIGDF